MVVGFVGKVPDLGHKGKNIPEAAEQEGSMQLNPNLARVFRKGPFYHFPILQILSDHKVNVLLFHWRWFDN